MRALNEAFAEWLNTPTGKACASDPASGKYLHNRLIAAFEAGWLALEHRVKIAIDEAEE